MTNQHWNTFITGLIFLAVPTLSFAQHDAGMPQPASSLAQNNYNREILPIVPPEPQTYTELDVKGMQPPPRFEVKAPKSAPNVVIVLIDDLGLGATTAFGGPIETPTMERLANAGIRYNNFNTTSLCSPTRMAIKTGRNHHTTNTGSIMETATAFPGNTGSLPGSVAPLAETLRLNGYSTAAFGKWHETARGKQVFQDLLIAGQHVRGLTNFTALLAVRRTNGHH